MPDFDREMEREEDREDAQVVLTEFAQFVRQRCCLFMSDDVAEGEILHGRLKGLLVEKDDYVIEDMGPEHIGLHRIITVPVESVKYVCHNKALQCKQCPEYKEMQSASSKPDAASGDQKDAAVRPDEPQGDAPDAA